MILLLFQVQIQGPRSEAFYFAQTAKRFNNSAETVIIHDTYIYLRTNTEHSQA